MYFNNYEREKIINEFKINWELDEEDRVKIITKLQRSKTFHRVFNNRYNWTNSFYRYILKYGLDPENHFVITIKGRTGSGKSSIGSIILYMLYKNKINLEMVVFNHLQQKRLLKNMGKNITIMRDEQTGRVGLGSKADVLEVQNWDETLRKDGINFIYIAPTDRYHGTAHKNLEFIASNRSKRISMFALYEGLEHQKFYTGFVIFKIPTLKWWKEKGNNFWYLYEKKKDEFNQKTRDDTHGIDWDYFIEEIKDHPRYNPFINQQILKSIIIELYVFQPKEFRDALYLMYSAKIGFKSNNKKDFIKESDISFIKPQKDINI